MRYSDLIKEYRQLRSIRGNELAQKGVSEKVALLHETDRIRILLVCKPKDPGNIRMEVEVSLPDDMWGFDANFSSNKLSYPNQPALQLSLKELITLFQYLINLQEAGFQLAFFSTEGVWVASYDFDQEPSKTLFAKFKPPCLRVN